MLTEIPPKFRDTSFHILNDTCYEETCIDGVLIGIGDRFMNTKFAIISGSTRQHSQSRKVSDYIQYCLAQHANKITIIDLATDKFPLWCEEVWTQGASWHAGWKSISDKLFEVDALVIVAPEWNGMVPPQLMNFFQLCSNKELFHKPGLIVTVSAGHGGSYPVTELRMSSFKNTKICYLPEHLIIRNVKEVLNDYQTIASEHDQRIKDRLKVNLEILKHYAVAFQYIRDQDAVKNNIYINGM